MKPFTPDAQVLGQVLSNSLKGFSPLAQKSLLKILDKKGIKELNLNTWYNIKTSLDFFNQVATEFGPNTLFNLGKSVPENAIFPPDIDSLENGLKSIDLAYNSNHRNGYVGFYKMVSHDLEEKKIIMHCYNPYPCDFDRGLIITIARKFKSGVRVVLDESKSTKKKGGNESWYTVFYR